MVVRTLVVWCRDWPVVAAGVAPDQPAAVLHANRVVAASAAARADGVTNGLRRREAQGRCPAVKVFERDETRDAREFEPVAAAVETVTPRLEITFPGMCALTTRGPSRYFGGDQALARHLDRLVAEVLGDRGQGRVGVADGPFPAQLAARAAIAGEPMVVAPGGSPDFMAPLPITALDRPELVGVLVRLGLRTLGALAELPAADVLARFGVEGAQAHRLASGLDERPPDSRRPPPDLAATTEIDPPAERIDTVAFVAKALADELHHNLSHHGVACTRVLVRAETEHGEGHERYWRHEGALTAGAIADRARWQLDGWLNGTAPPRDRGNSPSRDRVWASRPTGGVSRLELIPDEVVASTGRQLGFWGGETAADERAARALARLQGLVGPEAVTVPTDRGGRSPVESVGLVPADAVDLTEPRSWSDPTPWPGRVPRPSPATSYRRPVPAEVVDAEGEPVRVSGRGVFSAPPARISLAGERWTTVTSWAGPWPCDERWWDPASHRRRARFQVLVADGPPLLLALERGGWSVEAVYD